MDNQNSNKIKFYHFRNYIQDIVNCRGGVTLAIKQEGSYASAAISVCSIKDNFSKKRGRVISKGRLLGLLKISSGDNAFSTRDYLKQHKHCFFIGFNKDNEKETIGRLYDTSISPYLN